MNRLSRALGTTFTLQITALEEASRDARNEADLEHLFLALLLSEQPAGRALRSSGITLKAARTAIQQMHQEQLRSLGVEIEMPQEEHITVYETPRGGQLTKRAAEVMTAATRGKRQGGAAAVLRRLLDEPSGMARNLLARLDTAPEKIRAQLDMAGEPGRAARRIGKDEVAASRTVFIPAAAEEIWEFLIRPENLHTWDESLNELEPESVTDPHSSTPGDIWIARTPTQRADGTRIRRRRRSLRRRVELRKAEEHSSVEWRLSVIDERGNTQLRAAELFPTDGGTDLRFTSVWSRQARGLGRALRSPLIPALRSLVRLQAHTHATQISVQFR